MVLNCIILRWTKKQQHRENCVNHTIPSMFHSEILALLNFNKIKILSPGLENNHTLKRLFWQFSNITKYVKSVGKIPDQHLSVWLFSNPGDKVQILVESTGQICPVVLHLFLTLSPGFENNHTFKC